MRLSRTPAPPWTTSPALSCSPEEPWLTALKLFCGAVCLESLIAPAERLGSSTRCRATPSQGGSREAARVPQRLSAPDPAQDRERRANVTGSVRCEGGGVEGSVSLRVADGGWDGGSLMKHPSPQSSRL
ncbi:unnamed protein product [Lota lota]